MVHILGVKPTLNISLNDAPLEGVLSCALSFVQLLSISPAAVVKSLEYVLIDVARVCSLIYVMPHKLSERWHCRLSFSKKLCCLSGMHTSDIVFAFIAGKPRRTVYEIKRRMNCHFGRPCGHEYLNETGEINARPRITKKSICRKPFFSGVTISLRK